MAERFPLHVWGAVLTLALACLALAWQNRELKTSRPPAIQTERPSLGQELSPLVGIGEEDDAVVRVNFSAEAPPTLLLAISGGCRFCAQNREHWEYLSSAVNSAGWRVVWASRDPSSTAMETQFNADLLGIRFWEPTYRTYLQLGLASVPRTLVVAPNGRVDGVWGGVLADQMDAIVDFLARYDKSVQPFLKTAHFEQKTK